MVMKFMHDYVYEPIRIKYFDDYIVDGIKCGEQHSYVHTESGGHYLFGVNGDYECIVFDDINAVITPNYINGIIMEQCQIKMFVDVIPGYCNTKIICTV